jgi:hypothetical protein
MVKLLSYLVNLVAFINLTFWEKLEKIISEQSCIMVSERFAFKIKNLDKRTSQNS